MRSGGFASVQDAFAAAHRWPDRPMLNALARC